MSSSCMFRLIRENTGEQARARVSALVYAKAVSLHDLGINKAVDVDLFMHFV